MNDIYKQIGRGPEKYFVQKGGLKDYAYPIHNGTRSDARLEIIYPDGFPGLEEGEYHGNLFSPTLVAAFFARDDGSFPESKLPRTIDYVGSIE